MEPNILLIGKNIDTLKILKDELEKFKRKICYANSNESITSCLKNDTIDLIIVGAGLPENLKDEMVTHIKEIVPTIQLHIMEKTPGITPISMVTVTNEKAIMWRLVNARKSN